MLLLAHFCKFRGYFCLALEMLNICAFIWNFHGDQSRFLNANCSYIKSFLVDRHRPEGEASVLRSDLREARKEIRDLNKKVDCLTKRLEKYEAVEEDDGA